MQNIKCKKHSIREGRIPETVTHFNDFLFCLLIKEYMQLPVFFYKLPPLFSSYYPQR